MKKLIFAVAFLLIGSFGFASSSVEKQTKKSIETKSQKQIVALKNNDFGFCGVKVITSYVNSDGVVVGTTEEYVLIGISSNVADCQKMIRDYAALIGGTLN